MVPFQNPDETLADLKACLKAILVQFKREPAVERCVKYVVRLTTHGDSRVTTPNALNMLRAAEEKKCEPTLLTLRIISLVGEGEEAPLEDAFAMNVLEWLLSNSCAKVHALPSVFLHRRSRAATLATLCRTRRCGIGFAS